MANVENEISILREKMEGVIQNFAIDLNSFNLGQASVTMLENLKVPYYGSESILKSLANIAVLDILNLIVEPYDVNTKADIIQGLKNAGLGASINDEGNRIRVSFPPLSEDRKEELIKLAAEKKEEAKVVLRRQREEIWDKIQNQERKHEISEDDRYKAEEKLNKLIEEYNQKLEDLLNAKLQNLKS